ncbi:MAG: beta strand repeat-containing protein, partial [Chitinophagaceae bacterium]
NSAEAMVVGDIDEDGKADVVIADMLSGSLSVFRNTASSGSVNSNSFASGINFYLGFGATSMKMADLDGDGKPDLIIGSSNTNSLTILHNNSGNGYIDFSYAGNISTLRSPSAITLGDLDGDGKPEIVAANKFDNTISVFRNISTAGYLDPSSFETEVEFGTGYTPMDLEIADLDGDYKPDLAVVNYNSNSISVLRNVSSVGIIDVNSFETHIEFNTIYSPNSIAIGDLDGDGKPELAVTSDYDYSIALLYNTSTTGSIDNYSFDASYQHLINYRSLKIAIGDLNGDGKADLAITAKDYQILVLRNTATIGSINSSSFATGFFLGMSSYYFQCIAVADIDGDSKSDIISTSKIQNYFTVFRNSDISNNANLNGLSMNPSSISPSFSSATTNYTANVNNTINNISITATKAHIGATIQVRANGGSFQTITSGIGSGVINIVVGTNTIEVRVTAQDGTTIKTYTITVTRAPSSDANINSLTISSASLVPTFSGNTTNYSGSVHNAITSITVTPYSSNSSSTIQIRFNGGSYFSALSGSPSSSLNLNVGSNTLELRVTAQNGITIKTYLISLIREAIPPTITTITPSQGKMGDVITITGTGFNTSATNNIVYFGAVKAQVISSNTTSVSVVVPIGATYSPISILNQGTNLIANSINSFVPTYNPLKTTFTSADFLTKQDFATSVSPSVLALADVDGDGKVEISTSRPILLNVGLFKNTTKVGEISTESFATPAAITTTEGSNFVAYGDLNNDGKLDMVTVNQNANRINVFKNTSTTGSITTNSFASPIVFFVSHFPSSAAIGDVDGDGKLDIAVVNSLGNSISILRNKTVAGIIDNGSFNDAVNFATASSPRQIAIADLNDDGKLDLVTTNFNSTSISVLRNTSTIGVINSGSFAAKVDFATGTNPNGLATADFDGDTKTDIAVTNNGSNTISVFRNTSTTGTINSGSFAAKVDFATATNPLSIAVADVSGDGKIDIAVTNYNSNSVSIFQNTATSGSLTTGSFNAKVDFTTGTNPSSIAIGDVDGDGKVDVAITNAGSNNFSILRNNVNLAVWNGSSWSNTPLNTLDAFVESSITPTSFACNNLVIKNGYALNSTGITTALSGNLINLGNGISGIGNLNIESNSILSGNMLNFNGTLTVNTSYTFNTNGLLTLTSNASNTARVAPILGAIEGAVTVERYFNGKRAWRFITAPLSSSNLSPVYLNNSWQQQTHITGPSGTGFDAIRPNFSFLTHAPNAWSGVNNTQTTELFTNATTASNKAFAAFIRGNRSIDLNNIAASSSATLSASGKLLQGTQNFDLGIKNANDFLFLGNPYASPVDLNQMFLNSSTSNINRTFYTWDPTLSVTGGYVTISWNGVDAYTISPNVGTAQTQILQSGQAFFARATTTGAVNVSFEENDKSIVNNNAVFGAGNGNIDNLSINLLRNDNGNISTRDGVIASFGANYNKMVSFNEDAEKLFNNEEAIAIKRGSFNLSIERRPYIISNNDSIFLSFLRLTPNSNYTLNFKPQGWDVSMQAFLVDKLLSTETPINLQNSNQDIQISTTNATVSDRWIIVFKPSNNLPNNK